MSELKVLGWLVRRVWRRLIGVFCLVLINAASAMLGVFFALGSKNVIDSAVAGDKTAFIHACTVQFVIIVGTILCVSLARYLRDRLLSDLNRDWKRRLLHHLVYGEYAQVSAYHSGELMNRLNNDVRILDEGLVSILPGLTSMVVRLISAVAVLIVMEPLFTVVLIVGGIVAVFFTGFARTFLKNMNKRVSQSEGRVMAFFQETLERLLVVQAMDLAQEVERRSDGLLDERWQLQKKKRRVSLTANTGVSALYYLAGFAALVWCAFRLLHGRMTFGTLNAVTQLVSQLQSPFVGLSGIFPQYAAMIAAAERLMELETIQSEVPKPGEDTSVDYARLTCIGVQGLTFGYEEEDVLRDVSFTLPKGVFATIVGASGIGKSTLLKLMLGVFKPRDGYLYVEDETGTQTRLSRNTRRLFAYVPQGNFLFSGTLRDNLLISNPEASEEEIQQALQISAVDRFLEQLPDGLDTVLGENGAGLSEGQVQRLAIARALLSGAPILLLDEATSALDEQTERLVLERIAQLPGRTCIAVTHRPAALELADWKLDVADKTITAYPV